MSEREYLDLDDGLKDDGADAPAAEWDEDLLTDFPDDDPAASSIGLDEPLEDEVVAEPVKGNEAQPKDAKKKRRKSRSPGARVSGGGFLSFLLVLLGGLTLGSGLITATGATPETLLDFSGFRDPLTIGDFRTYPINAFWLAAAVTLFAGLLAAVATQRRVRGLLEQAEIDAAVLSAIRGLDPDEPETWQRDELQYDPELAAVTSGLLGHFNLQQAKLTRYVGLEGELHRLEKAMSEGNTADLATEWESPPVGSLADQCLRLLNDSEDARQKASSTVDALSDQGPDLVTGLRDARAWNQTTLERLNQQGAAAERLARQIGRLADAVPADDSRDRQRDRLRQALVAIQTELAALPARGGESSASLATLVEKASRLAFQIAMEAARLGAKGERLLPLTQDLEELTTELRKATDTSDKDGEGDPRDRVLETVRGRLAELDPTVLEDGGDSDLTQSMKDAAPVATKNAEQLVQIARSFNVQSARIEQMLNVMGDLTGLDVGGAGDAEADPGTRLAVEQFDPFGNESVPESGLVADPFASAGSSIFDANAQSGSDFQQAVLPGDEDRLLDSAASATVEPITGPEAETASVGVPSDDEKVYDLSEFDAVPLTAAASAGAEDHVYDLADFGAERIG